MIVEFLNLLLPYMAAGAIMIIAVYLCYRSEAKGWEQEKKDRKKFIK